MSYDMAKGDPYLNTAMHTDALLGASECASYVLLFASTDSAKETRKII